MDSKLLLIKAITLLYCESISQKVKNPSVDLARDIVNQLHIPEQTTDTDTSRNAIVGLRETLLWLCDQDIQEPLDFQSLLQRVRMNAGEDHTVFEAFEAAEDYQNYSEEELVKVCRSLQKELKNALSQWAIRNIIHKAHRELFYNKKPINWQKYIQDVVADLEAYSNGWDKDKKEFVMNLMSMSDPQSLKKTLEKAKEDTEGVGGLKSGWQAVNRMLGQSGHFRRGMFVLVGALTHCYKSGFVHDLFRHFCIYNDPVPTVEGKTPMLLYFSSENRAEEDIVRMYVALKENETGEAVDISQIDQEEASAYVAKRLTERGWEAEMARVDPNHFTYTDLFNVVLDYESKGYEIQAICFDYLALINRDGCQSSMIGEDVRVLMQKVRTFMSARNILFVTPHQLSQEAMNLKRSGVSNFVAEVAGKNYWDGSKRIANEADLEVYLDIVEQDKQHFLAIHRGKHRTVKATPKKFQHFFLPFAEVGFVPDDIHGQDRSLESLAQIGADVDIQWQ